MCTYSYTAIKTLLSTSFCHMDMDNLLTKYMYNHGGFAQRSYFLPSSSWWHNRPLYILKKYIKTIKWFVSYWSTFIEGSNVSFLIHPTISRCRYSKYMMEFSAYKTFAILARRQYFCKQIRLIFYYSHRLFAIFL